MIVKGKGVSGWPRYGVDIRQTTGLSRSTEVGAALARKKRGRKGSKTFVLDLSRSIRLKAVSIIS